MKKNIEQSEFTEKELKMIDAFCANLPRGKAFGRINVKKYLGTNSALLALNGTEKVIGTVKMEMEGERTLWMLKAIDGEKYRLPEPEEGIETLLEMEFKRNDV